MWRTHLTADRWVQANKGHDQEVTMSQSALTSPFTTLASLRMFRRAGTRASVRESISRTRPADVARVPRTDALRALDTDQIRVQSRIFLALR